MAGGADEGTRGLVVADRFELVHRLGHGGMGTVWRARDLMLERDVALKEVRTGKGTRAEHNTEATVGRRDRVLQEARALARVNHPHVVTIHHIVEAEPYPWIVTELLSGRTLATVLQEGPVPPGRAAEYGLQVLAALRAAHGAGVLHRDVKPANVLLREDGSAVLTDFGIARSVDDPAVQEKIVGSPEYLAPERILGSPGDTASDLWSLGVLLYTLVEGRPPFRYPEPHRTLTAVVEEPVPAATRAGRLAPVLDQLLVKDPAGRPDAARVADLLTAVAGAGETATASHAAPPPVPPGPPPVSPYAPTGAPFVPVGPPPAAPPPAAPGRRRGPLIAGVTAAVVALAAAAALIVWLPDRGDDGSDQADGPEATESAEPDEAPPSEPPDDEENGDDEAPIEDSEPDEPDPAPDPESSPEPPGAAPPADPDEGDAPARTWVAQLHSEPVSSGTDGRDAVLASLRADVPDTEVLRSDDYASLTPGYWVYYVPGPFDNGGAAVEYCVDYDRTTANECVGRYVSDDADHRDYVCHPDGAGRCED